MAEELTVVKSWPGTDQPSATSYAGSRLLQGRSDILGLLDSKADQYGVPRNLVRTVASMESSFNPTASSGKASGLMQLEPTTAKALGVKNVWDPEQNADGGTRLLRDLVNKYNGDTRLVLAAYNAGEGAVDRAGGVPNYPETQKYVVKGLRSLPANLLAGPTPTAVPAPVAPPAATPAETPSPSPATQPTAAQAASGIDDILARIGRGENVEVTPEDILRVAFGPTGVQTPPAAAAAPEPQAQAPLTVMKSWEPPPPPKPTELTPAQKTGWAFVQGVQAPQLLSPALSVLDLMQGKGLGPTLSAIPGQAKAVAQSFANELPGWTPSGGFTPGRALTEWGRTGESAMRLLRGDFSDPVGTLYHLFGSIPLAGGALQQIADKIGQGDPAAAMGLTGAFLVQVLGPDAAAEVAPRIMPAVDRAATAVKTRVGKVVDVATSPLAKDVIGVVSPRIRNILNLATRVGKAAETLRGTAPEAPAPAAAAPAAEAMTPGQILAKSQGQDWNALSANDQAMLEQIAKGQANVAAQPTAQPVAATARPAPKAPAAPAEPLKAGDVVQWTSQGVDQFQEPRAIRGFSSDGKWAFVEGTDTGFPVEQLTRAEAPSAPTTATPEQPIPPSGPRYRGSAYSAPRMTREARRATVLPPETGVPESVERAQLEREAIIGKPREQWTNADVIAADELRAQGYTGAPTPQAAPTAPPLTPQDLTELQTGRPPSRQSATAQQTAAETLATAQTAAPPAAPVAPEAPTGPPVDPVAWTREQLAAGNRVSPATLQQRFGLRLSQARKLLKDLTPPATAAEGKAAFEQAKASGQPAVTPTPEAPSELEQQLAASIREAQARKTTPAPVVQPGQTVAEALAAQAPPGPKSLDELMAGVPQSPGPKRVDIAQATRVNNVEHVYDFMQTHGITLESVEAEGNVGWRKLARKAGIGPKNKPDYVPSETTKALLRQRFAEAK